MYIVLVQEYLLSFGNDVSVERNAGTTVEVDPLAVATTKIGKDVTPATPRGRRPDHFNVVVSLPQLTVRPRAVDEDLNAVQAHVDV
jgi:hypothetical protein